MYEAGLGKVISGREKAPEAPADSEETAAASFEKDKLAFQAVSYTHLTLPTIYSV